MGRRCLGRLFRVQNQFEKLLPAGNIRALAMTPSDMGV